MSNAWNNWENFLWVSLNFVSNAHDSKHSRNVAFTESFNCHMFQFWFIRIQWKINVFRRKKCLVNKTGRYETKKRKNLCNDAVHREWNMRALAFMLLIKAKIPETYIVSASTISGCVNTTHDNRAPCTRVYTHRANIHTYYQYQYI